MKNIENNVIKLVFSSFPLLALRFGMFLPQIRLPRETLYILPAGHVYCRIPKFAQKVEKVTKINESSNVSLI